MYRYNVKLDGFNIGYVIGKKSGYNFINNVINYEHIEDSQVFWSKNKHKNECFIKSINRTYSLERVYE